MSREPGSALRVLIVHFNTPEMTARLVQKFPRTTPRGRRIFVHLLDNGSAPENVAALQRNITGLDGVTLDISTSNVGFGAGMNLLAERPDIADSDILWLLNSDTELQDGCLNLLERELDRGEYSVVSPTIFFGTDDDPRIWYCGGSVTTHPLRVQHDRYNFPLSEAPLDPFDTEFITGAAPMMRSVTFHSVGGFPRGYFLYWEDTFMSWAARRAGLRLGVVPSARLWHAVGASSGARANSGLSRTYYYWSTRNRFTFAQDTGIPRRELLTGRGGLESLRPIAKALLEHESRFKKLGAALRGTIHGIRNTHSVSWRP